MLIAIHIDQCMFSFHWQKQGPIYFDAFQEFFFLITCVTVSFICKEFKHHICKIRVVFLNVGLEIGENGANVFLFLSLFHWTSMSFCFFFEAGLIEDFIVNFLEVDSLVVGLSFFLSYFSWLFIIINLTFTTTTTAFWL